MTQMQTPPAVPDTPIAPLGGAVPAQPLLAGKFKTPAELEKGYLELQTRLGASQPAPQQPAPNAPPSLGLSDPGPAKTVDDILARAGLDSTMVAQQWRTQGKLTDQQYEALARQGLPRAAVDVAITGMAATAGAAKQGIENVRQDVFKLAGGEAQFGNMLAWAKANLTAEEQAFYNAQVEGPAATPIGAKAGAEWLIGKYRAAFGGSPPAAGSPMNSPSSFAPSASSGAAPYTSHEDKARDCVDPRYSPKDQWGNANPRFDQAFHEQVNARLVATHHARTLATHPSDARTGAQVLNVQ